MEKIIPYGRQYIDEEDIEAVVDVLKSDYLTQGPKVEEFEKALAKYHNIKYAVTFSNGTAALHGAYYASGIKEGEEFITSPITFAATANGGLYLGAKVKFVDMDIKTYCIDIDKIEKEINNKTRVITPVSFAGYPVDIKKIREIADRYNLKIIHDAAHAIGALRDGETIAKYADMTILSFHPVKHIAAGEGGAVLTNNKEIYENLILFRSHGITKDEEKLLNNEGPWYYEMQDLGYNYRMTDIQCALGISQMKKLNRSIYERNIIADFYNKYLKDITWIKTPNYEFDLKWLEDEMYINLENKPINLNSYHLYPILLDEKIDRRDFFKYMRKNNIWVQTHYIPVHLQPYYMKNFNFKRGDFPVAEDFYHREVSLPMFYGLNREELDYIIKTIKKYKE